MGGRQPLDALDQPPPKLGHGRPIARTPDERDGLVAALGRVGKSDTTVGLGQHVGEDDLPFADTSRRFEWSIATILDRIGIAADLVGRGEPLVQAMGFDQLLCMGGRNGSFMWIWRGREREQLADAVQCGGRRRHP